MAWKYHHVQLIGWDRVLLTFCLDCPLPPE
jgi:hypothetical protein